MKKFIVHGPSKVHGTISVSGAKNHALKLIPSCILSSEPCILRNVPDIEDVHNMLLIFEAIGGTVEALDQHTYKLASKGIHSFTIPKELAAKLRASIMFVGPLLARFGEARFPHPGGCIIGKRPIDIFLDGFEAMGVRLTTTDQYYHLKVAEKFTGSDIVFRRISVTATENLMMAATLAHGKTRLMFAAMEPEIASLGAFLNKRGAHIEGAGTPTITIQGVRKLRGGETACIPDRVETGTFSILAAATGSELTIKNCDPGLLEVFWLHLHKMGVRFERKKDSITILRNKKPLHALPEVIIHEYPGFITDLQAPMTVLLTQSKGLSLLHETIYEGRLLYTDTLNKMGAQIIMCDPHRIVIQGPTKLQGTKMTSPDIRAGIALVIAAIVAEGKSTIDNVYQINRGYENIVTRLQNIGVAIQEENS